MKDPRVVVFDLETQRSADEVGGWGNIPLMGLSVGVVWDSKEEKSTAYREDDIEALVAHLESADLVVGFNLLRFDYRVVGGYEQFVDYDFNAIPTFDILNDVHFRLGHRLSLDALVTATLKQAKTADGLAALQWFRDGELEKIEEYCIKDVELTRDLFYYGVEKGSLLYHSRRAANAVAVVNVDWDLDRLSGLI